MKVGRLVVAALAGAAVLVPSAARADELPRVTYDPALRAFSAVIPHGQEFFIDVRGSRDDNGGVLQLASTSEKSCPAGAPSGAQRILGTVPDTTPAGSAKLIAFKLPVLSFDQGYCFWFTLRRTWTTEQRKAVSDAVHKVAARAASGENLSKVDIQATIRNALGPELAIFDAVEGDQKRLLLDVLTDRIYGSRALGSLLSASTHYLSELGYLQRFVAAKDAIAPKVGALPATVSPGAEPAAIADVERVLADQVAAANKDAATVCAAAAPGGAESADCKARRSIVTRWTNEENRLPKMSHDWQQAQDAWQEIDAIIAAVGDLEVRRPFGDSVTYTSVPSYTERASWYISGNVGSVLTFFRNHGTDLSLFVGINFFFEAVDKSVPLRADDGFLKRFSIVAGYTFSDVKDDRGTTRGVFDGKGGLLGAGFRVTDYLQVGAGGMFVRQPDADPLVTSSSVRVTPYLNLSVDIDAVGTVKAIFEKGKL